jgi:hypothetical protein
LLIHVGEAPRHRAVEFIGVARVEQRRQQPRSDTRRLLREREVRPPRPRHAAFRIGRLERTDAADHDNAADAFGQRVRRRQQIRPRA